MIDFPQTRTFFRIVRNNPPDESDFRSAAALGRPMPTNARLAELWDGVSIWSSVETARAKAAAYPSLGRSIARLDVVVGDPGIRIRKTLGRHHFTAWADPVQLLACVVDTVAIDE